MVYKGTTGAYKRICLLNSKWIVEKEKYPKYIIRAEFYQLVMVMVMVTLFIHGKSFSNDIKKDKRLTNYT